MIIDTEALFEAVARNEEAKDFEKMSMRQLTASETIQIKRQQLIKEMEGLLQITGIFKEYAKLVSQKQ